MRHFEIVDDEIELYFEWVPSEEIRKEMKDIKIWWNPNKKCWHGKNTAKVLALAKKLCGNETDPVPTPAEAVIPDLPNKTARCCYCNSVKSFLNEEENPWVVGMKEAFKASYSMPLGDSQEGAWSDCFSVLKNELPAIEEKYPGMQIIFEYALPYESERRPDVILLSKEHVIVLEFKQYGVVLPADVDQVKAYARDIREYHYESRSKQVSPVLMLTGIESQKPEPYNGITLCSKGWIGELIDSIITRSVTPCDAKEWMDSKYEPLPTIVDAARTFMNHEELPNIRRVNSTVIPEAIKRLTEIAQYAKKNSKHVLALRANASKCR